MTSAGKSQGVIDTVAADVVAARAAWRRAAHVRTLAAVVLAALATGCGSASSPDLFGAEGCFALAEKDFGFATMTASWQEGNVTQNLPTFARLGLPAYCSVDAVIGPVPGSRIRVVYRLPEKWNGKVYGIGGGGWAGDISLESARDALARGFATMQSDAGKTSGDVRSPDVYDNTWLAHNTQAVADFSHRAIHEMTVAGKKVAAAYYGRQPDGARFVGCSTGGRMALMEAQRYPEDYDEIVAGSPVHTLQAQISALMAGNLFAAPGAALSETDLRLATGSAVAACDANDGLEDGLINDPLACHWDPATIRCRGAKTASCLTAPQVAALTTLYHGIKSPDGQWALWPISRGSETAWGVFINTSGAPEAGARGLGPLKPLMFPEREVDWAHFSEVTDAPQVRSSEFATMYEAKDPDLSGFFARGGKLLMWGGESDVGPAPAGVIDYARAVMAGNPRATQQFRAFLIPGVGHCGGEFGEDLLPLEDTVDAWRESDKPPETMVATMRARGMTRLVCASPKVARYDGDGDPNAPLNWHCVAGHSRTDRNDADIPLMGYSSILQNGRHGRKAAIRWPHIPISIPRLRPRPITSASACPTLCPRSMAGSPISALRLRSSDSSCGSRSSDFAMPIIRSATLAASAVS